MTSGPWRPDDEGRVSGRPRQARLPQVMRRLGRRALETPEDRRRVNERVQVLEWAVMALVALLLLGFWQTQVLQQAYYTRLADENLLKQSRVRPARGLILGRGGEILATNTASYEVAIVREATEDEERELRWLSEVLGEPFEVLQERMRQQRGVPRFRPVVVAAGIDAQRVVQIQARRREHPGVVVQVGVQRRYPRGLTAAHALGHVGEISPRQLTAWGARYRMGDVVGQLGVEGVYNEDLAGRSGSTLTVVNNVGREIRRLREEAPHPGETVVLTLDVPLQEKIEELLGERRGAVVAIDATTGGILALVSSPAFDPNAFAERFSVQQWQALIDDPARPLSNRALQASLPPGSIFKLVVAAAGLEEGVITPRTTYFCPGGRTLYGRFFRCEGQHGNVNVIEALAHSCNSFFYELGVKLGRRRIVKWAQRMGLGGATGIDLSNEQPGIVPSDEWLAAEQLPFYPGETVSVAIGQGRLAVSPLQLAHLAAIAATGFVHRPHLLERVEESSIAGFDGREYASRTLPAAFGEATRRILVRGMSGSVAYGTSWRARLADVDVGGKTGTAQVASAERVAEENADRPEHLRNHAWFVGVAPIEAPQIAVAVFLEHGGSGGRAAAPLGGEILSYYLESPRAVDETPLETEDTETATAATATRPGRGQRR